MTETILLVLFSGFLGALILKLMEFEIKYYKRPKLKFVRIETTAANYVSIIVRNDGKSPAKNCIGKVILNDGKDGVIQVPWGISLNPDEYTIYPKDELKLDLFLFNGSNNRDNFIIPIALGKESSTAPGVYKMPAKIPKGEYNIKVIVVCENAYLEKTLGKLSLPNDYLDNNLRMFHKLVL